MYAEEKQYRGVRIHITNAPPEKLNQEWIGYSKKMGVGERLIDFNAFNLWLLHKVNCPMHPDLQKKFNKIFANTTKKKLHIKSNIPLRDYQKEGIEFLYIKKGNALLTDEPGLGKTAQSICFLRLCKMKRAIIICPAHLKPNWYEEFGKFWKNDHVEVIYGTTVYDLPEHKTTIIINRHILKTWLPYLMEMNAQQLLIDEAHEFCNPRAQCHMQVLELKQKVNRVILITGTPLINKAKDLWVLFSIIDRHILGVYTAFLSKFSPEDAQHAKQSRLRPKMGKKIYFIQKPKVKEADLFLLHRIIKKTIMLRRLKKDVATELPEKVRQKLYVHVSSKAFWKAETEILKYEQAINPQITVTRKMIDRYAVQRQKLGMVKAKIAIDYIANFLIENPGQKLAVVAWHVKVTTMLHQAFKTQSYLINGKATPTTQEKHAIIKKFNIPETLPLLVANNKSIETGLNIPIANDLLVVELPYTGAGLEQVENRFHRLGKTNKSVFYRYMLVKNSLEIKIYENIIKQQERMNKSIDGIEGSTLEDAEIVRE